MLGPPTLSCSRKNIQGAPPAFSSPLLPLINGGGELPPTEWFVVDLLKTLRVILHAGARIALAPDSVLRLAMRRYLAHYPEFHLPELGEAMSPFVGLEMGDALVLPFVPCDLISFVHKKLKHYEDAARIIAATARLPSLKDFADLRSLAAEVLAYLRSSTAIPTRAQSTS